MPARQAHRVKHISDEQRRQRMAVRHGLHPDHRFADPASATRGMTVLHATEAATVHLSLRARVRDLSIGDVETALYDTRELVKQLAMRRTLFVFPRAALPAAWGSASARVAASEFRRLAADVAKAGVSVSGSDWVEAAAAAVVHHLRDGDELDAATLRREVPELDTRIVYGSGRWAQVAPVGPRVLTLLGARGQLVRGRNGGGWRVSRPRWTAMASWLGELVDPVDEAAGYADLVRSWLWTFGPGTETDLAWWLGATKTAVRTALAGVQAVPVALDSGDVGWVLPGDDVDVRDEGPWAALLPTLDPTTMGWKQRGFYLDDADVRYLFDSAGNAGTTAWWRGRVVGCWVQDAAGVVRVLPRRNPGRLALAALRDEAERLTEWLDSDVVSSIYSSPQMRGETLP